MVKINLRMPDVLHDRLKRAAEVSQRSLNAEILVRLNASLIESRVEKEGLTLHDEIQAVLQEVLVNDSTVKEAWFGQMQKRLTALEEAWKIAKRDERIPRQKKQGKK